MILQTAYYKLSPEWSTPAKRKVVADVLRINASELPWVRGTEVGVAADDDSAKGWDIALHLRFDSRKAAQAFAESEGSAQLRADHLTAVIDFEKSWLWTLV